MIKNVLPSLRQRAGRQRIYSRQKSIRSGTARDSFSQTPHMRGKVVMFIAIRTAQRITPACAGKSHWRLWRTGSSWDHPRVCGEKALSTFSSRKNSGSPPHVRGKGLRLCAVLRAGRITPACAGKRWLAFSCSSGKQDHPRMCGEKSTAPGRPSTRIGSPPHVRGKDTIFGACAQKTGITPACAGKRYSSSFPPAGAGDHPRMCGEKCVCGCLQTPLIGSPPHVRGKVSKYAAKPADYRITPACAGKSNYCYIEETHS